MRPDRLKKIRARHEQALTNLQHGRTPTTHETLALIGDLTDLLAEATNTARIRPPLNTEEI